MKEVLLKKGDEDAISAVQIGYEIIRVTFFTLAAFRQAKSKEKVDLFGVPCPILGGGPPPTTVHVFGFPYEGSDQTISDALRGFGAIKGIRRQKYISKPNVFNGTRMVTMIIKDTPPRFLEIGGYRCCTWFRGQPLVCNHCMDPGHKSADCPNMDKCCKCKQPGHFAPLWKNAEDATGLTTLPVNVPTPGVAVGLQRSLPPSGGGKLLRSSSPSSSPPPEEPALSEDLPADDSDSESETFVPESEEISCDVAVSVARATEFGKEPDPKVSSSFPIQVSMDCLPLEDSVNDASTPVPSAAEEDQSSVISDVSFDVSTMDDLGRVTCAPRKRCHGSDDSGDEGCVAAKITIASPDEPAPPPGEAPAEPLASSVVVSPIGALAPEEDSQVMDPPSPALEVPPPVGSASVDTPPS